MPPRLSLSRGRAFASSARLTHFPIFKLKRRENCGRCLASTVLYYSIIMGECYTRLSRRPALPRDCCQMEEVAAEILMLTPDNRRAGTQRRGSGEILRSAALLLYILSKGGHRVCQDCGLLGFHHPSYVLLLSFTLHMKGQKVRPLFMANEDGPRPQDGAIPRTDTTGPALFSIRLIWSVRPQK